MGNEGEVERIMETVAGLICDSYIPHDVTDEVRQIKQCEISMTIDYTPCVRLSLVQLNQLNQVGICAVRWLAYLRAAIAVVESSPSRSRARNTIIDLSPLEC